MIMTMPQIIFAQVLDEKRTAMLVRWDNSLLGGIAYMTEMTVRFEDIPGYFRDYRCAEDRIFIKERNVSTTMNFNWERWRFVEEADIDAFVRERRWERDIPQIAEVKKLEGPR